MLILTAILQKSPPGPILTLKKKDQTRVARWCGRKKSCRDFLHSSWLLAFLSSIQDLFAVDPG